MPKPLGYEPIHESNLAKEATYFLRVKHWGEGLVRVTGSNMNGTNVLRVRRFAEQRVNWYYMSGGVPGDNPRYVCHLNDFRCVFSHTIASGVPYRHLSISVPGEKYPSPAAVWMIADLFGFTGWDGLSFDRLPLGWQGAINEDEHCVVLAQQIRKEEIQ